MWIAKEGYWLSKFGKLFPVFDVSAPKEELEKPKPEAKGEKGKEKTTIITGEPDWKDYSVELKVRPDRNQAKLGIAVRYNPEDGSGYYLWIESIKQKRKVKEIESLNYNLILEKKTKNGTSTLQQTIYTNPLKWFIIEVMVEKENIEISIDGKKLIKAKDSEIQKGQITLLIEQRLPLAVIDDFVVRPIGKKLFSNKQNGKKDQLIAQSFSSFNSQSPNPQSPDPQPTNLSKDRTNGKGPDEGNGFALSDPSLITSHPSPITEDTLELPNPSAPELYSPDPIYQTPTTLPPTELILYYHHDHLGNIRAITDQNKNVVERHDFYPFGEEITTPQNKDSYLFTGKQRDSETGLDYFGARYYSSGFGRFLSVDPGKPNKKIPQTWNKYSYSLNNPLKYIDPTGKYFIIPYNDPNRGRILRALALGALTPSGSKIFWQIQRDPRPVIIKSGTLPVGHVFDSSGRVVPRPTFGTITNRKVFQGNITSVEATISFANINNFYKNLQNKPFGEGRIDPKGITTIYHELLHLLSYLTNPWPTGHVIAARQDKPTSESGPAQLFGETVFSEYSTLLKEINPTALEVMTQSVIDQIEQTQLENLINAIWNFLKVMTYAFGDLEWKLERKGGDQN